LMTRISLSFGVFFVVVVVVGKSTVHHFVRTSIIGTCPPKGRTLVDTPCTLWCDG